jgi:hypothetical protein
MGLVICVGFAAGGDETDSEYREYFERQLEAVNEILESFGLPTHQEPFDLEDERTSEWEMLDYSGLHYLRRLAAHLALKGELPPPGDEDAAGDPVLNDYYKFFDAGLAQGKAADMPFQHLLIHGDAEGYYLPVDFEDVIIPDASLEIAGGVIGSAQALLRECRELAQALEIPEGVSLEDEALLEAVDNQGSGETKWETYGVESFTCLCLMRACEASVETGAAVVFA